MKLSLSTQERIQLGRDALDAMGVTTEIADRSYQWVCLRVHSVVLAKDTRLITLFERVSGMKHRTDLPEGRPPDEWQFRLILDYDQEAKRVFLDVRAELDMAMANFPMWNSAHEGHSKIEEEFTELQGHVFMKESKRDIEKMRNEAVQLAASAVRFAIEICNEDRGRR